MKEHCQHIVKVPPYSFADVNENQDLRRIVLTPPWKINDDANHPLMSNCMGDHVASGRDTEREGCGGGVIAVEGAG